MPCPFFQEGRARYCHAAPIRKLILDGPGTAGGGRCTSPDYPACVLAPQNEPARERCPHLEEMHVQYCGASPVAKLVPFSASELSRCASSGYRYCDAYLSIARARATTPPAADLLYAPNHFWLEAESNLCHIGVDAFLAGVVGRVDRVSFVTAAGTHRPAVALTARGVEWPMAFPNPLVIRHVNSRLRSDPARLTEDPYGVGWLFEGWELPGRTRHALLAGAAAEAWQAAERQRLARRVEQKPDLSHEALVGLFQQFFSDWRQEE